jgi:hypothetical protein
MRQRQIPPAPSSVRLSGEPWLDVEHTALVEVTSEENGYPLNPRYWVWKGAGVLRAISVARNPDFPICNPTTADLARKAFCRMSD